MCSMNWPGCRDWFGCVTVASREWEVDTSDKGKQKNKENILDSCWGHFSLGFLVL